jgi:hypothetical protein
MTLRDGRGATRPARRRRARPARDARAPAAPRNPAAPTDSSPAPPRTRRNQERTPVMITPGSDALKHPPSPGTPALSAVPGCAWSKGHQRAREVKRKFSARN